MMEVKFTLVSLPVKEFFFFCDILRYAHKSCFICWNMRWKIFAFFKLHGAINREKKKMASTKKVIKKVSFFHVVFNDENFINCRYS